MRAPSLHPGSPARPRARLVKLAVEGGEELADVARILAEVDSGPSRDRDRTLTTGLARPRPPMRMVTSSSKPEARGADGLRSPPPGPLPAPPGSSRASRAIRGLRRLGHTVSSRGP